MFPLGHPHMLCHVVLLSTLSLESFPKLSLSHREGYPEDVFRVQGSEITCLWYSPIPFLNRPDSLLQSAPALPQVPEVFMESAGLRSVWSRLSCFHEEHTSVPKPRSSFESLGELQKKCADQCPATMKPTPWGQSPVFSTFRNGFSQSSPSAHHECSQNPDAVFRT